VSETLFALKQIHESVLSNSAYRRLIWCACWTQAVWCGIDQ